MPHQLQFQWTPFPFLRYALWFIAGILLAIFLPPQDAFLEHKYLLFFSSALVYFIIYIRFKHKNNLSYGVFAFFIFFSFGIVRVAETFHADKAFSLKEGERIEYYTAIVNSQLVERKKTHRAELKIEQIRVNGEWRLAKGNVITHFSKKESRNILPKYGDVLLIRGKPNTVAAPQNPSQFDYKTHLKFKHIKYQKFIQSIDYELVINRPSSLLLEKAYQYRDFCKEILRRNIKTEDEYAIAIAILLGLKDNLDSPLRTAYAAAGAMHILAVSGLHVGILFWLLEMLLGRLKRKKYGKWLFMALILLILWAYAMITGFSPSVLRAVIMFSFILIIKTFNKRQTSIYNSLAFSAILLLTYDPYLIMSLGFQLSYIAVLGIVYFTQQWKYWYEPPNKFYKHLWEAVSVSFAAQIATAPLVMYYFHQLPTYFWLSNILIGVLVVGILGFGISLFVLWWIPFFEKIVGLILHYLVMAVNTVVFWIESLPFSVLGHINISAIEVALLYAMIACFIWFFRYGKFKQFLLAFLCILCFTISYQQRKYEQNQQQKIIVYQAGKQANLCLIEQRNAFLFSDSSLYFTESSFDFTIATHWNDLGIRNREFLVLNQSSSQKHIHYQEVDFGRLIVWHQKKILWIDKKFTMRNLTLQVDYLILSNNAVWNVEDLKNITFEKLIIDGSYYPKNAEKFKNKYPNSHITSLKGAWVKDLKE